MRLLVFGVGGGCSAVSSLIDTRGVYWSQGTFIDQQTKGLFDGGDFAGVLHRLRFTFGPDSEDFKSRTGYEKQYLTLGSRTSC